MGTSRSNEPPLPMALVYFLTWPTYGTWLPGDERGWVEYRHGWQLPDSIRKLEAEARMTEDACTLDTEERAGREGYDRRALPDPWLGTSRRQLSHEPSACCGNR
jgi:hypothetical protein